MPRAAILTIAALVACSSLVSGQNAPSNPRDLTGTWLKTGGNRGFADARAEVPPFTAEGQKRFDANKPSRGRLLGSADAAAHPEEHIGRRRAVPPALSNDLIGECNPLGIPRLLFEPEPFEIIQTNNKVMQFFQWGWTFREMWTDGRVPDMSLLPTRWYGYSTGRWDGDTFVVSSVGFDARAWLDYYGYPFSDQMRLEERYRRVAPDRLELRLTVTDPVIYTKPFQSDTKVYTLLNKDKLTIYGWTGLQENLCAPIEEFDFNQRIRNPAVLPAR
jgi:hypothetical protein